MTTPAQDQTVEVELGGRTVSVPKGGLYDRYRMATDLDVVAADPRVTSVDWFRSMPKTPVESRIGPTMTPNFYYRISFARVVMLAQTRVIRSQLPAGLDPLQVAPGRGIVSVMFFRYDVADIDFYTEAAVGIAVRPARHGRVGAIDLFAGLADDHVHTYVLALPVNTEIAQIRGHDGYGFPKWVTDLDVEIDNNRVDATVANAKGGVDMALSVATPGQSTHQTGDRVSTLTSYTQIDGAWHSTFSQTNVLAGGSKVLPRDVNLTVGEGRMSDALRTLSPGRVIRLDVVTNGQLALHLPVPTSVPTKHP